MNITAAVLVYFSQLIYIIYLFVCVGVGPYALAGVWRSEVRGQLAGVDSLLPLWEWNPGMEFYFVRLGGRHFCLLSHRASLSFVSEEKLSGNFLFS